MKEIVIKKGPVYYGTLWDRTGGELIFTDERLLFIPSDSLVAKILRWPFPARSAGISLDEISYVNIGTILKSREKLIVVTRNGESYVFYINPRQEGWLDEWASVITRITQAIKSLTHLERRVLDYIKSHDYKVRISDCAKALGVSEEDVENAMKSLEGRGLLKLRTTQ
ncbi:MAG: hypothetical protein ACUVTD_08940 [Nitrososphaerales archaeon]